MKTQTAPPLVLFPVAILSEELESLLLQQAVRYLSTGPRFHEAQNIPLMDKDF